MRFGGIEAIAEHTARQFLIPEHRAVRELRPGDVVLADATEGPTLGIAGLNRLPMMASNIGIAYCPWPVRRAWRIG
jgi:hypothetical protein